MFFAMSIGQEASPKEWQNEPREVNQALGGGYSALVKEIQVRTGEIRDWCLPSWQAVPAARESLDDCLSDGDFGDPPEQLYLRNCSASSGATRENQSVLWDLKECCEDPNLDRHLPLHTFSKLVRRYKAHDLWKNSLPCIH